MRPVVGGLGLALNLLAPVVQAQNGPSVPGLVRYLSLSAYGGDDLYVLYKRWSSNTCVIVHFNLFDEPPRLASIQNLNDSCEDVNVVGLPESLPLARGAAKPLASPAQSYFWILSDTPPTALRPRMALCTRGIQARPKS
jgi:hypothetical protein